MQTYKEYIKNTRMMWPDQKRKILGRKVKNFKKVKEIDPGKVANQYAKNKGK